METITPDYVVQNRRMHEVDPTYGSGSWRWAQKVMDLRDETDSETVLDYGCGKGRLKKSLGDPDWFWEFDPAVPGKDVIPRKMADIVVCTDVLEHIEPDLLDNVLHDIAVHAKNLVFLVIATRQAKKSLPDGTNTHKIVQDAKWWREKLSEKFFISEFEPSEGELVVVGSTIRKVEEIKSKSAVSETIRYEQALRNCTVVKERVLQEERLPRHDGRVAIVAYGPSLKQTWHNLKVERRAFGTKIVTVSGSHDFLIERGIVPDYHVDVDPRIHKSFFTRNSHPDVTYWVASCCHPTLIDNLVENKRKVALWHVYNSDTDRKIIDNDGPDPGNWLVCGGGSVGCRAVNLMYTQGYRSFSMYGMDCSYSIDGDQHAGPHSGKPQMEWTVRVGERWFKSSGNMVYTARGFIHNLRTLKQSSEANNEPFIEGTTDRVEVFFHGDGLLQEMAFQLTQQKAAA